MVSGWIKVRDNEIIGDGEFYVITRDGMISKVSRFNGDVKGLYFSERYSWSQDGRYLAFWLESLSNGVLAAKLAVLDTLTGKTTDYCLFVGILPTHYGGLLSKDFKPHSTLRRQLIYLLEPG